MERPIAPSSRSNPSSHGMHRIPTFRSPDPNSHLGVTGRMVKANWQLKTLLTASLVAAIVQVTCAVRAQELPAAPVAAPVGTPVGDIRRIVREIDPARV